MGKLIDSSLSYNFFFPGNGYVRSEAAVVIFLQKVSAAKRVYATVVNIEINTDGYKEDGPTYPSRIMQSALMTKVIEKSKINPLDVAYVEAHCTGTKVCN